MPSHVLCASCGYSGQLPDEFAGMAVPCPRCGQALGTRPAAPSAGPIIGIPADTPAWTQRFVQMLADRNVLSAADAWSAVVAMPVAERGDIPKLAQTLARQGKLTWFQAALLSQGKADQLVLGNYVLLDKIGEGGFGTVYKARHRRMQRVVALKVLLPEVMRDRQALQRFQREVETAAKLTHPNIVTAFDADEAGGAHFLAMEFVDGPDLGRLLKKQGPLPTGQAVDYVVQAARGLGHAHAAGIIHRDVKPSNLLLDRSGVVKVSDLGLARVVQPEGGAGVEGLTATRNIMGTVDYMAPEQALNTKTVDARADVYSLGCTLGTLLTGRPIYPGNSALEIVLAHREMPIPQLPASAAALQGVFARMVAKRPEDRYPEMAQAILDLQPHAPPPVAVVVPTVSGGPLLGETAPAAGPAPAFTTIQAAPLTAARVATPETMMAEVSTPPVIAVAEVPVGLPLTAVHDAASFTSARPSGSATMIGTLPAKASSRRKLWWAGGAGLLVVLAVVGWFAFSGRGKTGPADNSGPTRQSEKPLTPVQPPPDVHALIREAVKEGKVQRTEAVGGGFARKDFEDLPTDGGILIGFEVGLSRFANGDTIGYLRGIYLKDGTEQLGAEIGKRPDKIITLKAKKGYALAGVRISSLGVLYGLAVTFKRLNGKLLEPTDAYESEWVGGQRGSAPRKLGGGSVVIGFYGKTLDNGDVGKLGLISPVIPTDWIVVFRSDNPAIWNDDVNKGPNHYAQSLELVPDTITYLRLTNTQTNEYVILEMSKQRLKELSNDGKYGWEGRNIYESNAHHLGITHQIWRCQERGDIAVSSGETARGWGFGHSAFVNGKQFYSWEGKEIPKTVFEIAVKAGDLTKAEAKKLLKAGVVRE